LKLRYPLLAQISTPNSSEAKSTGGKTGAQAHSKQSRDCTRDSATLPRNRGKIGDSAAIPRRGGLILEEEVPDKSWRSSSTLNQHSLVAQFSVPELGNIVSKPNS